jgi:hypothetical protein
MNIREIAAKISDEFPISKEEHELCIWLKEAQSGLETSMRAESFQDHSTVQAIIKVLPFYCKVASMLKKVNSDINLVTTCLHECSLLV